MYSYITGNTYAVWIFSMLTLYVGLIGFLGTTIVFATWHAWLSMRIEHTKFD